MNDLLSRIAETDPDFAKSLRRNQVLSYVFAAVAIAAVLGAAYAIAVNFGQDKEITQVQHSACQEDPASKECQSTKLEAAQAAGTYVNCVPFWKAGYPCPKPGSTAAERQAERRGQSASGSAQDLDSGSGGESAPASGDSTSGAGGVKPGHGEGTSGETHGGTGKPPKPHGPSPVAESPPASADPSPDATAPQSTPPALPEQAQAPGPVRGLLEEVGETVKAVPCSVSELLHKPC